jgi:hypothetical protein
LVLEMRHGPNFPLEFLVSEVPHGYGGVALWERLRICRLALVSLHQETPS